MVHLSNTAKKVITTLGLIGLTSCSLNAQTTYVGRSGIACNLVKVENFSDICPGVESSLEREMKNVERVSAEASFGFYADFPKSEYYYKNHYSKIQANLGLKYYPILKNGWHVGAKVALGISSEFYKTQDYLLKKENRSTASATLDIEKMFKKKNGVNLSVSRELDRNVWGISAKWVLRSKRQVPPRKNWN
jgi:hypothetical protein